MVEVAKPSVQSWDKRKESYFHKADKENQKVRKRFWPDQCLPHFVHAKDHQYQLLGHDVY